MENEKCPQGDEAEAERVVPSEGFFQVGDGKDCENDEGDDFLNGFQLGCVKDGMADAVGRDLQAVFEKRDAPRDQDHGDQAGGFEFEVAVPCESHEDVGGDQQEDCGQGGGHGGGPM
jgi:hypothetical protein